MLNEKTKQIKSLCKSIKTNFLDVGKILIEIRDKELWKEKYNSFTGYLESEKFEFTRQYAYNMMDVQKLYVKSFDKLSIAKLIELTYVREKKAREDITKKAIKEELTTKEIREEILFKQIHRKSQREDEDLIVENDDPLAKCFRLANNILQDINKLRVPMSDMDARIKTWINFSSKFKNNKELETFKAAIFLEWKKLRSI